MPNPSRATLPRLSILRGYGAFSRVFSGGQGFRRGQIAVRYLLNRSADGSARTIAAGFVVRRNAGSAVKRNRLRRLLRESYRLQRQRFEAALPEGVNLEFILIWSGSAEQALRPAFTDILSDVEAGLRKLLRNVDEQSRTEANDG
jgi:ribonuclease P protein component